MPSLSAALTDGRNDSLAAGSSQAVVFVLLFGRQRLHARSPPFLNPSLSSPLPFQQDYVPAPRAKLFLRAVPPELPAGSPPSA